MKAHRTSQISTKHQTILTKSLQNSVKLVRLNMNICVFADSILMTGESEARGVEDNGMSLSVKQYIERPWSCIVKRISIVICVRGVVITLYARRCSDSIVIIYSLKCIRRWAGDALISVKSYKKAVNLAFRYNALSNSSFREKALMGI